MSSQATSYSLFEDDFVEEFRGPGSWTVSHVRYDPLTERYQYTGRGHSGRSSDICGHPMAAPSIGFITLLRLTAAALSVVALTELESRTKYLPGDDDMTDDVNHLTSKPFSTGSAISAAVMGIGFDSFIFWVRHSKSDDCCSSSVSIGKIFLNTAACGCLSAASVILGKHMVKIEECTGGTDDDVFPQPPTCTTYLTIDSDYVNTTKTLLIIGTIIPLLQFLRILYSALRPL
jgi:hypothetical protein